MSVIVGVSIETSVSVRVGLSFRLRARVRIRARVNFVITDAVQSILAHRTNKQTNKYIHK